MVAENRHRPFGQRRGDPLVSIGFLPAKGSKQATGGEGSCITGEGSDFYVLTDVVLQGQALGQSGELQRSTSMGSVVA